MDDWFIILGVRENVAEPLGFGLVIGLITYLSLIIGELVPKQIALRNPERIACLVAPAMTILAKVSAPSPMRKSTPSSPKRNPKACWSPRNAP